MDRVLLVCTANVCRSPLAERILQYDLAQSAENAFMVRSAGLMPLTGSPMDPRSAAVITAYGADPSGFSARGIDPRELADSTAIIAMTRAQRSALVELLPAAHHYTFTLRELGRVARSAPTAASQTPAQRLTTLVQYASRNRATYAPRTTSDDDVADPYGKSDEAHRRMADLVLASVQSIAAYVLDEDREPSN